MVGMTHDRSESQVGVGLSASLVQAVGFPAAFASNSFVSPKLHLGATGVANWQNQRTERRAWAKVTAYPRRMLCRERLIPTGKFDRPKFHRESSGVRSG